MEFLYRIAAAFRDSSRGWAVIALSLLLAFGIWLLTNLSSDYVSVLSVNVVAESNLEGRMETSSNEAVIQARCRTSGFNIRKLHRLDAAKEPRRVRINAADLHPARGEDAFFIPASALEKYVPEIYGDNVRLEGFVTDTVVFRFLPESHKKVPVVPVKAIRFRSQYVEMAPLRIEPDSVTVYGDSLLLDRITQVRTEAIQLNDVSSNLQDFVDLDPIPGTRYSTPTVRYSITVSRAVEMTREVEVRMVGVPEGKLVRIYPAKVRVTLFAVFPMLSDPFKNLDLQVDYADFAASLSGDCIPKIGNAEQRGVISVRIEPEVVHCVEELR